MKLLFAGTSHGIPEADRFCSSIFVQAGGNTYIVDAGAPVSALLRRYGIDHDTIRAVFVTHMHDDHFDGLPELCAQMNWYFKNCNPQILLPEQKGVDLLTNWIRTMLPNESRPMHLSIYAPGVIFDDGVLRVTARPTKHMAHAHGFVLEADGQRVLITGDMSGNYPEFPELLCGESYDAIVCEAAHHADYRTLAPMFAQAHTKRFIVTHINPEKLPGIEALRGQLPFDYDIAFDGMAVEV